MSQFEGVLSLMHTSAQECLEKEQGDSKQIRAMYDLESSQGQISLNRLVGQKMKIVFTGKKQCLRCSRVVSKTFAQGYCFPCFRSRPETDLCIVKPQRCHYHQGTCRDSSWGKTHCMQDHAIYLAYTSNLKIGLTRAKRRLNRWIDQGATYALEITRLPTRLEAGRIEAFLSQFFADRTHPKKMLAGIFKSSKAPELLLNKETLWRHLDQYEGNEKNLLERFEAPIHRIHYPRKDSSEPLDYQHYKLINLDKTSCYEGELTGIKGQYFILDYHQCFSLRKHCGYGVSITWS